MMLCFLVKAHHHWNIVLQLMEKSVCPAWCFSLMTNCPTAWREVEVLLLYGILEISQQNSSTSCSCSPVRPTSSSTFILLDLPRMLSYRVPLGIPYLTLAWVNLSCCLMTQLMAWYICVWVHWGNLT